MGRGPDRVKRESWARRLREFERGDESVVEFCEREGVSVRTFHRWRRTLKTPAAPRVDRSARVTPGAGERMRFVPVEIVASAASRSAAAETIEAAVAGESPSSTTTPASAARVEALLPGGVRLLVPCDEPAAIRAVVGALVQGRREDSPC